jgi:PBSX family phage portal protein
MEMDNHSKPKVGVRIIKQQEMQEPYTVFYGDRAKPIEKSDRSEQLHIEEQVNASDWIEHPVDMYGLKTLVDNSTILPQCIRAYKSNIAGFGIGVRYSSDYKEETDEMKQEWDMLTRIIDLLNMDCMSKEVFEKLIADRETYGVSYAEVIRDMDGNVVQLDFITDTPSVDMTCPLPPHVKIGYFYKGETVTRQKKFRKFRQNVGGKTVYFKEFGDPRIMDKRSGMYWSEGEEEIKMYNQANELIAFTLGNKPYGEVRWIGDVLTVDGNRRAEVLNNNYFRRGRHTPLMILVKGGTLSESSFEKLQAYMNEIEGENGQHSFLVLETDTLESSTAFTDEKQPDIEVKDMAAILQKDELFQEYQEKGRKKVQSAFLLPDLYTGYTTDFNRATAQTAMEVTEKQVFQPERESISWIINNKLLNGYNFKYVEAYLKEPDTTNPDDIQKILNITERAGGLTPNVAKEYTYKTLGKDGCEDYPEEWGDTPLAYSKAVMPSQAATVTPDEMRQLDRQISKASSYDEEIVPVLMEIKKVLNGYSGKAGD